MSGGGPGRPDVAVSLHALESDAVRWTGAAADLRAAAAAAAGQVLAASAFSFVRGPSYHFRRLWVHGFSSRLGADCKRVGLDCE